MTDLPGNPNKGKLHPLGDEPGFVDGIPVEELVRMTREFTSRIVNEDRQRLTMELNEGGRSIQSSAPFFLQQFFTGKIDLDIELSRRFPGAPLLSTSNFTPAPGIHGKHGFAQFQSQDNSAVLNIEIHGNSGNMDLNFLIQGMVSIEFSIGSLANSTRRRFLELMHRQDGIAFLWTRERWEHDYLIFVMRDKFVRVYAFGPGRYTGICRLTPPVLDQLLIWLDTFWADDGSEPEPEDPLTASL